SRRTAISSRIFMTFSFVIVEIEAISSPIKHDEFVKSRPLGHWRNEVTKQSNNIKVLQTMRLLRFARNDGEMDFLRNHQT
ncbi:MAG: hypothetical protein ABFD57_00445, partial [Smithella sp.]